MSSICVNDLVGVVFLVSCDAVQARFPQHDGVAQPHVKALDGVGGVDAFADLPLRLRSVWEEQSMISPTEKPTIPKPP